MKGRPVPDLAPSGSASDWVAWSSVKASREVNGAFIGRHPGQYGAGGQKGTFRPSQVFGSSDAPESLSHLRNR